jgi:hypothetical protein
VDAGGEGEGRGEDVDKTERRVVGHQVAAALEAILALAHRGLGEGREMLLAGCHPHGIGLPEREGVDGPPDQERQDRQWQ